MSGLLTALKSFFTPTVVVITTALLATITTIGVILYVKETPPTSFAVVTEGALTQTVNTTGTVNATVSVDLGFQRAGTIASIPVAVGIHVGEGQLLATQKNGDLAAAVEQAKANVVAAQAKLAQLQAGTLPQQLSAQRTAVAEDIQGGYIAADDAVHNKIDQYVINPNSPLPSLNLSTSDSVDQTAFINEHIAAASVLADLQNQIPSGNAATAENLVALAQAAEGDLLSIQTLLNSATAILAAAIPTTNASSATIVSYQTATAAGRTEVSGALQALSAAAGQLSVDEAGATAPDVQADEAAVASAQAGVDAAQAQLSQSIIYAPIAGTITRQNGNPGEVTTIGESFLSLQSDARFEVESYVSEADVAEIAVGNRVSVLLDSYPGASFDATVIAVDPAATMQNGIPSYKVTAQFIANDSRIKAGLTANLFIISKMLTDTLMIPTSAIITEGTSTAVVRIDSRGVETLTPVVLGIATHTGETQIISGLSLGDRVLAFGSSASIAP